MYNSSLHNEPELLHSVACGDQRAFALLIDSYGASVYAHVLTYLKNTVRAEEITQDIFLTVWNHREQLPTIQNFRGYLFVLTRNRTISAFREKVLQCTEAREDDLQTDTDPGRMLEYRQLSEVMQLGINQLPERRRQVFTMSRFDGKTYEEIAADLNISKSAVNKHIIEALGFLRTFLRNKKVFLLTGALFSEIFF